MRALASLALAILASACAADVASTDTAADGGCAILDHVTTIDDADGKPIFTGVVRDFEPMPCASPIVSCGPWRAEQLCRLSSSTFERHTWTLDGNAGDVTFERETNTIDDARDLHFETPASE